MYRSVYIESIKRSNNDSTDQSKYYTKDTIQVSVSAPTLNASLVTFASILTGIFYFYLTNEWLYYLLSPSTII